MSTRSIVGAFFWTVLVVVLVAVIPGVEHLEQFFQHLYSTGAEMRILDAWCDRGTVPFSFVSPKTL